MCCFHLTIVNPCLYSVQKSVAACVIRQKKNRVGKWKLILLDWKIFTKDVGALRPPNINNKLNRDWTIENSFTAKMLLLGEMCERLHSIRTNEMFSKMKTREKNGVFITDIIYTALAHYHVLTESLMNENTCKVVKLQSSKRSVKLFMGYICFKIVNHKRWYKESMLEIIIFC